MGSPLDYAKDHFEKRKNNYIYQAGDFAPAEATRGAMKTNEVCDCPLAPLAADTAMLLGFRRE